MKENGMLDSSSNFARHPKGLRARVLLTSVFGPYARDDEYGSRTINPMELYQNQVTRFQGAFSLRMFHRSFGLMMIQNNINAPCTLLDFPDLDRFVDEIRTNAYDVIGIGSIIPDIGKVIKMCALIRMHAPEAVVVVGGHVANAPGVDILADADHVVKGDGVAWFRRFLGQDPDAPVHHPMAYSAYGAKTLGVTLRDRPGDTAAILIPSVGCPVGCNFCSTSALFGGKGHHINFYDTGDALFEVMDRLAQQLKVQSFFVLDENFLLHRKRALRLLELMEQHHKSWSLYVFSSARVLKSYTMEQLVGLGVAWVWMGLEGKGSRYAKLNNVDAYGLVKDLQSNGICVLGSSIIGLEDHRPEDMDTIIADAVRYATDFHQFMLYTPNPGTPLYEKHVAEGSLLDTSEFSLADAHGQYRFNYRHRHIKHGKEEQFLRQAFERDFAVNGPSLARLIRTQLNGWQKFHRHPNPRIRRRFKRLAVSLSTTYASAVWAMRKHFAHDGQTALRMALLLKDLKKSFGLRTRIVAPLAGTLLRITIRREEQRLAAGYTYEPQTYYEKNPAALGLASSLGKTDSTVATVSQRVACMN
jgi:radical SAM superfamily enzyme YgiQ (UPF0313 family)